MRLMDGTKRNLVFDNFRVIPGGVLRHDETRDVAFFGTRPNNRDITAFTQADPFLFPIEHPLVTITDRRGFQRNRV